MEPFKFIDRPNPGTAVFRGKNNMIMMVKNDGLNKVNFNPFADYYIYSINNVLLLKSDNITYLLRTNDSNEVNK